MSEIVSTADRAAAERPAKTVPFATALRFWTKLGFISFGGPAGQIAIMHSELVDRRRWISEGRFLHALNYCMVLPGPEAQQLATYIGWLLHGTVGGIVAGGLFVLPSFFVLMALSWIYFAYGNLPAIEGVFLGVKPTVVAIVAFAVVRIGSRVIRSSATFALAAGAFVLMYFFRTPFPIIVLGAGVAGLIGSRIWPKQFQAGGGHSAKKAGDHQPAVIDDQDPIPVHALPKRSRTVVQLAVGLALWLIPVGVLLAWQGWHGFFPRMAIFFTEAAFLTFGGAYAVLPYVAESAIRHYHWLRPGQMIDGLALGETTPGPLIMVVTFVGAVGGWQEAGIGFWGGAIGGAVATYFTFLPSFLFVLIGGPWIEATRGELRLAAFLSGVTAAVVGVILDLAFFFGRQVVIAESGEIRWFALALSIASFLALWRLKLDIVRLVLIGAVIGLLARGFLV